jgi:undecaprenyl-diphosphatase
LSAARNSGAQPGLTVNRALLLGALQGPAELLPVSSSAHLSLVPWFAGWRFDTLRPASRKDFEVALHAGTAAGMLIGQGTAIGAGVRRVDLSRAAAIGLAAAVPALVGLVLERPIEERFGGPRTIAAGLVAGAAAMLLADRRPQDRSGWELGPADGLALGAAQAAALFPGVSRTGATVAASRSRRFSRAEASALSRTVALPVVVGAAALRLRRRRRGDRSPAVRRGMAAGGIAAVISTLASQRLIPLLDRGRPWPYAAYRLALAGAILAKLRRGA